MKYDWHLTEAEVGMVSWVGAPFQGDDGIMRVTAYIQTEGQCYYSRHAWSTLPFLKIGSICRQGKEPQPSSDGEASPAFSLQELASRCSIGSVAGLLEENRPELSFRIKQQELSDSGVYFEHLGVMYVIPQSVVLTTFLGDMSPLVNGVLHEGIFDEWINDEIVDDSGGIEVNFTDVLSARFLSSPGTVEHIVWLRYTPQLYDWWKAIAVSYYRGKFEVPIPIVHEGMLTFWGERRGNCFVVQRMEISGVRVPFRHITWTHPRVREKDLNDLSQKEARYIGKSASENLENDTSEFAHRGVPRIEKASTSSILFENPPVVCKKRIKCSDEYAKKQRVSKEENSEKVSTNEPAVGGRLRPMNTISETEPEFKDKICLQNEFARLGQALATIPGLHISNIDYIYLNEYKWVVIRITYAGRMINLVEGSKGKSPCASTLLWGGDYIPLADLLNGGNWDKKKIERCCKAKGVKSALLRHAESRTAERWGLLMAHKMHECL